MFRSKATDLVPGSYSGNENLFVRDLQAGTTYALTTAGVVSAAMTPDGRVVSFIAFVTGNTTLRTWDSASATQTPIISASGLSITAISPDGNRIVYSATGGFYLRNGADTPSLIGPALSGGRPGLRFSGDSRWLVHTRLINGTNQVCLYDCETGDNLLISHKWNSAAAATGPSDWPAISSDGRFVAYRSAATDLVLGATNGIPAIFLYDRMSGVTTLFGVSRFGNHPAANRSLSPVFSDDGQTLLFGSWAPDMTDQDSNQGADVFAYQLCAAGPVPFFHARIVPGTSAPPQPLITWPAVPGKTYRVQFKNDLSDPAWEDLDDGVTVLGNSGYFSDPATAVTRRFYRIVAF
jgi:Tol biopolymer transport system component